MNELGGYEWVYYQNLRAKRGFAKQKAEMIKEMRMLEHELTLYILMEEHEKKEIAESKIFRLIRKLEEVCQ